MGSTNDVRHLVDRGVDGLIIRESNTSLGCDG
jgi:hypothetical protein